MKRVLLAILVAALAAGVVYWAMTEREGRFEPSGEMRKAVEGARDAAKTVERAAEAVKRLPSAARKAKDVVTSVPRMYRRAAEILSGDATP